MADINNASRIPPNGFHKVTDEIGPNPNDVSFYTYVPSSSPEASIISPTPGYSYALVLALHYCTGSAQAYFDGTKWSSLADQHKGFFVIYGDSPREGKCWDNSSPETLRHDGGGDSLGVASMIRYAIKYWNVDPERIFVTGHSSGAMMTNVMAGTYPELFRAAASSAGVPCGAFATQDGSPWCTPCALGQITKSPTEWGNLVRSAFPSYTGPRPSIQLWHGTEDDILSYVNFGEAIKQWTDVLGLSSIEPVEVTVDDPVKAITRSVYRGEGGTVEAYSVQGGPHNIDWHEDRMLSFFGI